MHTLRAPCTLQPLPGLTPCLYLFLPCALASLHLLLLSNGDERRRDDNKVSNRHFSQTVPFISTHLPMLSGSTTINHHYAPLNYPFFSYASEAQCTNVHVSQVSLTSCRAVPAFEATRELQLRIGQ